MEKNQEMTISTADGKSKITQIVFTFDRNNFDYCSTGSYSGFTWTASDATSSVTFKRAGGYVRVKGMTITYEAASVATKQYVTLSMPESASIDLFETFDAAASLTERDGGALVTGPISYSIEPATGDFTFNESTGLFTAGKTNGSYTIKASFAGDKNYNYAEAFTTVTVNSRVWALKEYLQVTDESQVFAGGQYLLVYDDGEDLNVMSTFDSNNFQANNALLSCNSNKSGNLMSIGAEYAGAPFILEAVGDYFALKTSKGYLQCRYNIYTGVTSYGLNVSTTSDSPAAQWTVTIADGKVRIVNVYDTTLELCHVVSSWSKTYSYFDARTNSGTLPALTLYAKCAYMPFKAQALGYGTFVMPDAYKMPAGVTGYAISGLKEENKLQKVVAYTEGQLVPALTPLLVYNANVSGADETAYPILVNKEVAASYTGQNYLEYKRNAEDMTASKQGGDVYYKLTKNTSEENYTPLGFYWGAKDGAAFRMENSSTAYLALPQNLSAAAGLLFDEAGEATGIQLTPAGETAAPAVYNLQGVRVSGKLAKGLYIVNGKKVLVK